MEEIKDLIEEGFSLRKKEGYNEIVEVLDGRIPMPLWTFAMLSNIYIFLVVEMNTNISFERLLKVERASTEYVDYDKQLYYNISSLIRE